MKDKFAVAAAVVLAEAAATDAAGVMADAPSWATSDAGRTGTSPVSGGMPRRDVDKAPSFAAQKQGMVDALPKCDGRAGETRRDVMAAPRPCTILWRTVQRCGPGAIVNVVTGGPHATNQRAFHRPRPSARRDRVDPEDRVS
jgi:hypothetical protein